MCIRDRDEDWSKVSVDKLMNQISGLTRAVAYKKRVELQNKNDLEALSLIHI